ncbi:hypothetical protein VTJ49DRAFT_1430 [Mycothermus thermophilus]|uniref:Ecp2 effector protein-like domain-containing protein n=1 Tax=Humicola insolens TaxID=85995 RepID=A0ABR3VCG2_HUMIN
MQFKTLVTILTAAFAAGVTAAPAPAAEPVNAPVPATDEGLYLRALSEAGTSEPLSPLLAARAPKDTCGHSSFNGDTNDNSPTIADCQRLASNLSGEGTWMVYVYHGTKTLATYGTCKFTATTISQTGTYVGDTDVQDLIRDSIRMFGKNGRIGAYGAMNCHPASEAVFWSIRRN